MRVLALPVVLLLSLSARAAPRAHRDPAPAKRAAPSLAELLAEWKRAPGLSARFREEKHLAMLDAPLVNEGTIHFAPPQRLARRTLSRRSPRRCSSTATSSSSATPTAGRASISARTPWRDCSSTASSRLLAGDREGLERYFPSSSHRARRTAGAGWQLTLVPKVSPMDKVIKELTFEGEGLVLREMEIRETSGDWTRTTFTDVDVNHRYTPAEQDRIFRLPASMTGAAPASGAGVLHRRGGAGRGDGDRSARCACGSPPTSRISCPPAPTTAWPTCRASWPIRR